MWSAAGFRATSTHVRRVERAAATSIEALARRRQANTLVERMMREHRELCALRIQLWVHCCAARHIFGAKKAEAEAEFNKRHGYAVGATPGVSADGMPDTSAFAEDDY